MLESPYEIFMERVPGLKIGTHQRNGTSCNFARSVFSRRPRVSRIRKKWNYFFFREMLYKEHFNFILFFFLYASVQCVT